MEKNCRIHDTLNSTPAVSSDTLNYSTPRFWSYFCCKSAVLTQKSIFSLWKANFGSDGQILFDFWPLEGKCWLWYLVEFKASGGRVRHSGGLFFAFGSRSIFGPLGVDVGHLRVNFRAMGVDFWPVEGNFGFSSQILGLWKSSRALWESFLGVWESILVLCKSMFGLLVQILDQKSRWSLFWIFGSPIWAPESQFPANDSLFWACGWRLSVNFWPADGGLWL